jgi:hypothetical protein
MSTNKPYFPDEKQLVNKLVSFVTTAVNENKGINDIKRFRPMIDITRDANYRFTLKNTKWKCDREVEIKSIAGDSRAVNAIYMLNCDGVDEPPIREERIKDCSRENIFQLGQRISVFLTTGQFEKEYQ